jgi:hypothetical protein
MSRRTDAAWAWACALLAAAVSIAVNVGHASPVAPGFVAFAATLPVMIVGAAELMVRRLLPAWIVGVIGVSAYALSFWHTVLLLLSWGEPAVLAVLGSVAVDGLMVGATVALYRLRRMSGHGAVRADAVPDAVPDVRTDTGQPQVSPRTLDVRPAGRVAALDVPRPRAVRTVVALPYGADPRDEWLRNRPGGLDAPIGAEAAKAAAQALPGIPGTSKAALSKRRAALRGEE